MTEGTAPNLVYLGQPQPAPRGNGGEVVADKLIEWLESLDCVDTSQVVDLVRKRDAFGRQKYGTPLTTEDGRDEMQDALEEMGDLLQYLFKARMNRRCLHSFHPYVSALLEMVAEDE